MEKHYQVFVSSTYKDLVAERAAAINAILSLGHMPSGMELFPSSNATPWEIIEKVIDECDYYVVVIGQRYGSMDQDGLSYTEREYDHAHSNGKPVLAFLQRPEGDSPVDKVDVDQEMAAKLAAFREPVLFTLPSAKG